MFNDNDFKTSSFSSGPGGMRPSPGRCVAVAIKGEAIAVRDTKDATKMTLNFTREEWEAFVSGVKNGEFDV
jgi:hypothetical protein